MGMGYGGFGNSYGGSLYGGNPYGGKGGGPFGSNPNQMFNQMGSAINNFSNQGYASMASNPLRQQMGGQPYQPMSNPFGGKGGGFYPQPPQQSQQPTGSGSMSQLPMSPQFQPQFGGKGGGQFAINPQWAYLR